jgi:DNA-directed RNA polymerase subunit F
VEAADYLGRAARLDPERYREKVDNIIRMLPQR